MFSETCHVVMDCELESVYSSQSLVPEPLPPNATLSSSPHHGAHPSQPGFSPTLALQAGSGSVCPLCPAKCPTPLLPPPPGPPPPCTARWIHGYPHLSPLSHHTCSFFSLQPLLMPQKQKHETRASAEQDPAAQSELLPSSTASEQLQQDPENFRNGTK
uniref:Uncharacterized protein n=1 Tax=Molossus molossus TaxID=27622 RepID=A0A7J8F9F4_MOLMO|nr:hypothetical protein HJG59_008505 [Molossus molossus]